MEQKTIHVSGSRKKAVARATLTPGKGIIRFNTQLLSTVQPMVLRDKLSEPLLLAGDAVNVVNINIKTNGGGIMGQADAARVALARSLVVFDPKLEPVFLDYDRFLLVADVRHKESRKPNNNSKARAKRQKSYR